MWIRNPTNPESPCSQKHWPFSPHLHVFQCLTPSLSFFSFSFPNWTGKVNVGWTEVKTVFLQPFQSHPLHSWKTRLKHNAQMVIWKEIMVVELTKLLAHGTKYLAFLLSPRRVVSFPLISNVGGLLLFIVFVLIHSSAYFMYLHQFRFVS